LLVTTIMAEKSYYIRIRGKVLGPFPLQKLQSLRDRGQLARFHELSEDRQSWQPASVLSALFADVSPVMGDEEATYPLAQVEAEERTNSAQTARSTGRVEWYYVDDTGQQAGPFTRAQLSKMWAREILTSTSLVWKEGMSEWQTIGSLDLDLTDSTASMDSKMIAVRSTAAVQPGGTVASHTFVRFLGDPVGSLPALCNALGNAGSFWLGLAFCAVFDACLVFGLAFLATRGLDGNGVQAPLRQMAKEINWFTAEKATLIVKLMVVAVLPMLSLGLSIAFIRMVTSAQGCLGYDMLIAGSTLLPQGLLFPIAVLLGLPNLEVIVVLNFLTLCLSILILNSGFTRVLQISDRGAILALPASLLLTIWLSKVVITAVVFG
jgi:hypothetical protein